MSPLLTLIPDLMDLPPRWWRVARLRALCRILRQAGSSAMTVSQLPLWDGQAQAMGEAWTLRKGPRVAVCHLWTHPIGGEARLEVDGELLRTEAGRAWAPLVELALTWRDQFMAKGWTK